MKTSFAILTLLGTSIAAHASTVDVRFVGVGQGREVRIAVNGGGPMNVFAGQLRHELTNGTDELAGFSGVHRTYCTDLLEHVTWQSQTYTLAQLSTMPNPAMGTARANAVIDLYGFAAGTHDDETIDADFAAAFQVAIWEVVSDYNPQQGVGSLDLGSGTLRVSRTNGTPLQNGILNYYNSLIGAIGAGLPRPNVQGLARAGSQDQVLELPQEVTLIPLPGAGAMGLAGLAMLASRRRRA